MELRVAFQTLGCKLNQLETEALEDAFRRAGSRIVAPREPVDLFIINTCTVTERAEAKARRLVRQVLAGNPGALVLVTGCWAQVDGGIISGLGDRVLVIPGEEKSTLFPLASHLNTGAGHGDLLEAVQSWRSRGSAGGADPFAFITEDCARHSRPSLKVQDGCDNVCGYCRVRLARGPSRSLPAAEALGRVRALEAAGRAEVVLTGVNLHQYREASGADDFTALLRLLLEGTDSIAFRVSSWEPEGVDEAFLEVFAHPRVRPHLHLPIQSGSDAVLRSMCRAYRRDKVISSCEALRRAKGDLFIAADLMAGYPGEGEDDFEATMDLARRCDLAWIHAFPFSPRPGTKAWDLSPKVGARDVEARVTELRALAWLGRRKYLGRQSGSLVEAVLEGSPRVDGRSRATSSNYLRLLVEDLPARATRGRAILCRLAGTVISSSNVPIKTSLDELGEVDSVASFVSMAETGG